MTVSGCPYCGKIFHGEFPCPNCGFKGGAIVKRTVFDLDPVDREQVYAREIWHPKIEFEGH